MTPKTVLRRMHQVLATTAVAAVSAACLVSAPSVSTSAAGSAPASASSFSSADIEVAAASAYPAFSAADFEHRVLHFINVARHRHHLRLLTSASCAEHLASRWSNHLAATDSFYHQSMPRLLRVCHAHYVGETLGRGMVGPRTLVSMWLHSPPHRHILLDTRPRHVGIGATPDGAGDWVVAADLLRF